MVLSLTHEYDRSLFVAYAGRDLLRYVYVPTDAQLESPRPYFHPLRTLDGDVVSLYRPHDHVWHKGIALSLPNVGPAKFWGGATYVRDRGYVQLPDNGAMVHRGFDVLDRQDHVVRAAHRLDWITEQGEIWFEEARSFGVTVHPCDSAWVLGFTTSFTNVSGADIAIGSPTTEGREAGDAVFTVPPSVLADPSAYAAAAALDLPLDAAAHRRDLAVSGFLALRSGGSSALSAFYEAAARIVQPRVAERHRLWEERVLSAAQATGEQRAGLSGGTFDHLLASTVSEAAPLQPQFGMCGHLGTYAFTTHP